MALEKLDSVPSPSSLCSVPWCDAISGGSNSRWRASIDSAFDSSSDMAAE